MVQHPMLVHTVWILICLCAANTNLTNRLAYSLSVLVCMHWIITNVTANSTFIYLNILVDGIRQGHFHRLRAQYYPVFQYSSAAVPLEHALHPMVWSQSQRPPQGMGTFVTCGLHCSCTSVRQLDRIGSSFCYVINDSYFWVIPVIPIFVSMSIQLMPNSAKNEIWTVQLVAEGGEEDRYIHIVVFLYSCGYFFP